MVPRAEDTSAHPSTAKLSVARGWLSPQLLTPPSHQAAAEALLPLVDRWCMALLKKWMGLGSGCAFQGCLAGWVLLTGYICLHTDGILLFILPLLCPFSGIQLAAGEQL